MSELRYPCADCCLQARSSEVQSPPVDDREYAYVVVHQELRLQLINDGAIQFSCLHMGCAYLCTPHLEFLSERSVHEKRRRCMIASTGHSSAAIDTYDSEQLLYMELICNVVPGASWF